jgi:hypothetical protein
LLLLGNVLFSFMGRLLMRSNILHSLDTWVARMLQRRESVESEEVKAPAPSSSIAA